MLYKRGRLDGVGGSWSCGLISLWLWLSLRLCRDRRAALLQRQLEQARRLRVGQGRAAEGQSREETRGGTQTQTTVSRGSAGCAANDHGSRPWPAAGGEHWPRDRRAPLSAVRCSARCVCVRGHCGCTRNLLEGRDQIRPGVRLEVASIAHLGAEKNRMAARREKRTRGGNRAAVSECTVTV